MEVEESSAEHGLSDKPAAASMLSSTATLASSPGQADNASAASAAAAHGVTDAGGAANSAPSATDGDGNTSDHF